MRKHCFWIPALLLTACGGSAPDADRAGRLPDGTWAATLEGRPGFEQLDATVTATPADGSTTFRIEVDGAAAGVHHAWYVHEGSCASGGAVVGELARYPVLQIGINGSARGSAVVPTELQPGGEYHVALHPSPRDTGGMVACGELRAAG